MIWTLTPSQTSPPSPLPLLTDLQGLLPITPQTPPPTARPVPGFLLCSECSSPRQLHNSHPGFLMSLFKGHGLQASHPVISLPSLLFFILPHVTYHHSYIFICLFFVTGRQVLQSQELCSVDSHFQDLEQHQMHNKHLVNTRY